MTDIPHEATWDPLDIRASSSLRARPSPCSPDKLHVLMEELLAGTSHLSLVAEKEAVVRAVYPAADSRSCPSM